MALVSSAGGGNTFLAEPVSLSSPAYMSLSKCYSAALQSAVTTSRMKGAVWEQTRPVHWEGAVCTGQGNAGSEGGH